jgi:hypothetical protein
MSEIGHLLRCYGLFSTAYRSSEDVQELLVDCYKNIVVFWQKAARLLSKKGKFYSAASIFRCRASYFFRF